MFFLCTQLTFLSEFIRFKEGKRSFIISETIRIFYYPGTSAVQLPLYYLSMTPHRAILVGSEGKVCSFQGMKVLNYLLCSKRNRKYRPGLITQSAFLTTHISEMTQSL